MLIFKIRKYRKNLFGFCFRIFGMFKFLEKFRIICNFKRFLNRSNLFFVTLF
ncbi:hypothetical protein C2G38_2074414 [Gigaspora rosea]|uniref:Uncharacterized protein n=1 Tax=Gigaspora rosea TaxID=44941 RepID=A0A397VNK3_9GLOM|nr:hypothetical protein C2G38_2074414 [Gigaspora rosea]